MSDKQRLFVDIDGTLAVFQPVDTLETLYEKGYFINLPPHENVVEAVKNIMENNNDIEVFIMSAVLTDSKYALDEKNKWLDKYLPQIDEAHRIFPPCGKDKKDYIPEGVRSNDFLLDDYTNNLTLWQPPAKGIKLLNGINNTKGTWKYDRLDYRKSGDVLAENIVSIMTTGEVIRDTPRKDNINSMDDYSNSNRFAVLQLKTGDKSTHLKSFRSLEDLKEAPTGSDYEIVYFEAVEPNVKPNANEIYSRFNENTLRPSNYYGHSMSVSDVLLVAYEGETEAFYCDDFGFKKLDNSFITEKLKSDFERGLDIRKEFDSIYDSAVSYNYLLPHSKERLSYLDNNYRDIFGMADKRAVVLSTAQSIYDFYDNSDEAEVDSLEQIISDLLNDNRDRYRVDMSDYLQAHASELSEDEKSFGTDVINDIYYLDKALNDDIQLRADGYNFHIQKLGDNNFLVRSDSQQFGDNAIVYQDASFESCLDYIERSTVLKKPSYYVIKDLATWRSDVVNNHGSLKGEERSAVERFDTVEEAISRFNEYKGMDYLRERIVNPDTGEPMRRLALGVSNGIGEYDLLHTVNDETWLISDAFRETEFGYRLFPTNKLFVQDLNKIATSISIDKYSYYRDLTVEELTKERLDVLEQNNPHDDFNAKEVKYYVERLLEDRPDYLHSRAVHETVAFDTFNPPFLNKNAQIALDKVPHREEDIEKYNTIEADNEKSIEEQKSEALYRGITNVMDSSDFKIYCDSMNKLMYNSYSPANCSKILMQWVQRYCDEQKIDITKLSPSELNAKITEALKSNDKPTYLMGYEAWKQYGRQVTGKGVAYSITAPNYVSEYGGKGSLLKSIKKSFNEQFAKNPNIEYASFRLGNTGLSFYGYKNGLLDIVMNGNVVQGKQTEELVRRFLDTEVIGKMPNGFSTTFVYDVKNTKVPEYLWVRNGYTRDELALNENGEPITRKPYKNSNSVEYKIVNTEERKGKFNPHISQEIKELDSAKMETLFEVLQKVSENKGVPMTSEPIEEKGTKGFFSQKDNRIVIKDDLSATEKCAVAFHEMAHADMHYQRKDISREMKEVQAEAVAYMTAQNFGIETSTSSFNYIAVWSKGRDVKELETSMNDILRQSKKLFKEISDELGKRDLDLNIEPINKEEDVKTSSTRDMSEFVKANKQFVLEEVSSAKEMKAVAKSLLDGVTDVRCTNILKEQIDLCNKAVRKLNSIDKTLNIIEDTSEPNEIAKLIEKTNKSYTQVLEMKEDFSALSEEYVERVQELKTFDKLSLRDKYEANPVQTMKDYIENSNDKDLQSLTDKDLSYIAKSKYISEKFVRDIKTDMGLFMKNAVAQAKNAELVKAKNGAFIEVSFCENWGDTPIFRHGAVAHPKTANKIIEQAEKDIRALKIEAEKAGDYYPYAKCYVTLYTEGKDGLVATSSRIDLGDGCQKNLSDHLNECCRGNSAYEAYSLSLKERVKDKIVEPTNADIPLTAQKEIASDKESAVAGTVGMKELKESVALAQSSGEQPQPQSPSHEHSKQKERSKDRV